MGDWTCLHSACRYGHRDIVGDLIVKYKCDKEKVQKVYNVIVKLCTLINTVLYTHFGDVLVCTYMHTLVMNGYCVLWEQTIPLCVQ